LLDILDVRSQVECAAMKIIKAIIAVAVLAACAAFGQAPTDYANRAGESVDVFEVPDLNFRLDLAGESYKYFDLSSQVPDAVFGAMRWRPNVFSMVIVEDMLSGLTAKEYAGLVQITMAQRLDGEAGSDLVSSMDLGTRHERGMDVFQKKLNVTVESTQVGYVLSTIVDGSRAYQLMTFSTDAPDEVLQAEADRLVSGFSIIEPTETTVTESEVAEVDDYRSSTFGYRFRARDRGWFSWNDAASMYAGADVGALSAFGYGSVVMPMCWRGRSPNDVSIYRVMMQQVGADYPSEFINEETDVARNNASGKLFVGIDQVDGDEYVYMHWIVADEHCAYALVGWGPRKDQKVRGELEKLWAEFELTGKRTAVDGAYATRKERETNAYLVNALGLHYHEARSYREAFRFFEQSSNLVPADEIYVINALRALVELDAFGEARVWLGGRLEPFADNQHVRSWDAWLAYQTGDADKALATYEHLFDNGYRDDEDFAVYMTALADAGRWEDVDREFDDYVQVSESESTQWLQVRLLTRRERFDDALALLDRMSKGRPFNADLTYERITVLDAMGQHAEVLELVHQLIDNGYRSLQSYYYKGNAEYQLRSYREARRSFEQALTFAPGNSMIRDYLDAINQMLGESDTTTISEEIAAVQLPPKVAQVFASDDLAPAREGYGAVFEARVTGYEFDGSETITQTSYRKIHVLDDNGISRFSTLEFDFDPAFEQIYVNRLRVTNEDGTLRAEGSPDSYYLTHSESGYEASTEKTVHLPVPNLAPGTIIEAVVTKRISVEPSTFPLETIYLSSDRPIGYSALFVRGKHENLRWKMNVAGEPDDLGDVLIWQKLEPTVFRWEPLQPYFDQILPWVQVGTVSENWTTAGSAYLDEIRDKLSTDGVAERAMRLVDGVDNDARKLEILSAYVQGEIHYKAIEFGRRAYIPKTARETLRDRYGDCKDHAVLLYAMLRAIGLDAKLALVNLYQQVSPELPDIDQFDHMIVSVELDGERLFVDATDKDMRLGQMPPLTMAGNFALELGEVPDLVRIPEYTPARTGIEVERVVEPLGDGYLDVAELARFTGYQAAQLRNQLRSIETSELQASLQRWLATRYADAQLVDYVVDNVFDAEYDLLVEIRYRLPIEPDGSFDLPGFFETYYLDVDRVEHRRFAFEHRLPLRVASATSIQLPDGKQLGSVPKGRERGESRFGSWHRQVSEQNDGWEIGFHYVASEERFDPDEYREFTEFQRAVINAIEHPLVIE
jgi:transglutaminase-like putative cysteine protease/tetratricopeptide (TPR) repeat protein